MVRLFWYCLLIVLYAGCMVGGSVYLAWQPNALFDAFLASPNVMDVLEKSNASPPVALSQAQSPLLQQASLFGQYVDPPAPPKPAPKSTRPPKLVKPTIAARPQQPKPAALSRPKLASARFEVWAISVYQSKPEKSMALILEPGTESRWVRMGEKVGHVLIEGIEPGHVAWRQGAQTGLLAVLTEPKQNALNKATVRLAKAQKHSSIPPVSLGKTTPPPPKRIKPIPMTRGLQQRR